MRPATRLAQQGHVQNIPKELSRGISILGSMPPKTPPSAGPPAKTKPTEKIDWIWLHSGNKRTNLPADPLNRLATLPEFSDDQTYLEQAKNGVNGILRHFLAGWIPRNHWEDRRHMTERQRRAQDRRDREGHLDRQAYSYVYEDEIEAGSKYLSKKIFGGDDE